MFAYLLGNDSGSGLAKRQFVSMGNQRAGGLHAAWRLARKTAALSFDERSTREA